MNNYTNYVKNTAVEAQLHPEEIIEKLLVFGSNDVITSMEREGAKALAASSVLPAQVPSDWAKHVGIEILGTVEDDHLFVHVKLPEGWTVAETEHDMWTELRDKDGHVRANIFYKAAFYDRRADIHPIRRYQVQYARERIVVVRDRCNEDLELWRGPDDGGAAEKWLDSQFPEWRDPCAYW